MAVDGVPKRNDQSAANKTHGSADEERRQSGLLVIRKCPANKTPGSGEVSGEVVFPRLVEKGLPINHMAVEVETKGREDANEPHDVGRRKIGRSVERTEAKSLPPLNHMAVQIDRESRYGNRGSQIGGSEIGAKAEREGESDEESWSWHRVPEGH